MKIHTGEHLDQFRIRREQQLFEHRFLVRATETRKGVLRLLEDQELNEIMAKQVAKEMEDFFKDSTRLAARVFGSIEEREARKIEIQVAREMEEFFNQLTKKVESLVGELSGPGQLPKIDEKLYELLSSPLEPLEKVASSAAHEHMDDQDGARQD